MQKFINVTCMVLAFTWMMMCALGYREYNTVESEFDKLLISGLWFNMFLQCATDTVKVYKNGG